MITNRTRKWLKKSSSLIFCFTSDPEWVKTQNYQINSLLPMIKPHFFIEKNYYLQTKPVQLTVYVLYHENISDVTFVIYNYKTIYMPVEQRLFKQL